jgi:hypothetical protein
VTELLEPPREGLLLGWRQTRELVDLLGRQRMQDAEHRLARRADDLDEFDLSVALRLHEPLQHAAVLEPQRFHRPSRDRRLVLRECGRTGEENFCRDQHRHPPLPATSTCSCSAHCFILSLPSPRVVGAL